MIDGEEMDYHIPAGKPYVVLEMSIGKKCYATPAVSDWLSNVVVKEIDGKIIKTAQCSWPSDEKNLDRLLAKRSDPKEDWLVHSSRILKFCIITGTLSEAKTVTDIAADKTDIESEQGPDPHGKRPRKPIERYFAPVPGKHIKFTNRPLSSSDSENEHAPPLKSLKITNFKQRNVKSGDASKLRSTTDVLPAKESPPRDGPARDGPPRDGPPRDGPPRDSPPRDSPPRDSTPRTRSISPSKTAPSNTKTSARQLNFGVNKHFTARKAVFSPRKAGFSPRKVVFSPRKAMSSPRKTISSPSKSAAVGVSHKTFMREINSLKHRLDNIRITVSKIHLSTCPVLEIAVRESDEGLPPLPLDTESDIEKFEMFLKAETNNMVQVVRLFADHGRDSVNESVKAMMPKLLTNNLASLFNMDGINKTGSEKPKKGFKGTPSHNVILAALKNHGLDIEKNNANKKFAFSIEAANSFIGKWLKNAPKRFAWAKAKQQGDE